MCEYVYRQFNIITVNIYMHELSFFLKKPIQVQSNFT